MKFTSRLFNYSRLTLYNLKKYDGIFIENHISGDEIAIKDPEGAYDYYYPLKKNKKNYLLPTEWRDDLPLKAKNIDKIPFKNKGYHLINEIKSVKFASNKTMEYDEQIDSWLPYEHLSPEEWTVWKIVTDVAYRCRINARAISYPGAGKDSPLVTLSLLRMDVASADKPSYAKLKWLLSAKNKIIGLNEVQKVIAEEKRDLSKFYETTGAFEPFVVFDKRATAGVGEMADLEGVSSLTFYNIPKDREELLFDNPRVFAPKVVGRIFPLMLSGGSHKTTAILESFSEHITEITDEEVSLIDQFVENQKYYEDNWQEELKPKLHWKLCHHFTNNRWERNYVTICNGLKMYAKNEEQFQKLEQVLLNMHNNYQNFVIQWQQKQSSNNVGQSELTVDEESI